MGYSLNMSSEVIMFKSIPFRRYPEAERRTDRVYFTPGIGHRQKGWRRLHEEIWMEANGKRIPPGHHVHHIDFDPLNNDPANLQLLTKPEHHRLHGKAPKSDKQKAHLESIRPLAAEWHGSEAGIEWHREHGRKVMAERPIRPFVCDQCGAGFHSKHTSRFCSNKCKSAWRRDSGIDNEDRTCVICGASFSVNKYFKGTTCSRQCAGRLRRSRRTDIPKENQDA